MAMTQKVPFGYHFFDMRTALSDIDSCRCLFGYPVWPQHACFLQHFPGEPLAGTNFGFRFVEVLIWQNDVKRQTINFVNLCVYVCARFGSWTLHAVDAVDGNEQAPTHGMNVQDGNSSHTVALKQNQMQRGGAVEPWLTYCNFEFLLVQGQLHATSRSLASQYDPGPMLSGFVLRLYVASMPVMRQDGTNSSASLGRRRNRTASLHKMILLLQQ